MDISIITGSVLARERKVETRFHQTRNYYNYMTMKRGRGRDGDGDGGIDGRGNGRKRDLLIQQPLPQHPPTTSSSSTSTASMLQLKAELYKSKQEFDHHARSSSSSINPLSAPSIAQSYHTNEISSKDFEGLDPRVVSKRLNTSFKHPSSNRAKQNKKHDKSNTGIQDRIRKDLDEENGTAGSSLEASYVALQRKARMYDDLTQRGGLDDDEEDDELEMNPLKRLKRQKEKEDVLVDFLQKKMDQIEEESQDEEDLNTAQDTKDDPWVETTDEFGRTRLIRQSQLPKPSHSSSYNPQYSRSQPPSTMNNNDLTLVSADMQREFERQAWERDQLSALENDEEGPTALPYYRDDVRHFDSKKETRSLGTGFYQFSTTDDAQRAEQMKAIAALRDETVIKRDEASKKRDDRLKKLEERRQKVKSKLAAGKRKENAEEAEGKVEEEGIDDVLSFLQKRRAKIEDEEKGGP